MRTKTLFLMLMAFSFHQCISQTVYQQVYHAGSTMIQISNIAVTYDNGFVMGGTASPYQIFGSGPGDVFLQRADSAGNVLWAHQWDLGEDEQTFAITLTHDTCYILTGFTFGATTQSRDGFILKIDDSGNIVSVSRIDHNGASNTFHSIRPAEPDGYIFSGRSGGGTGGQYDMYLCKADSAGNILWGQTFGGNNWDWGWWAEQTSDGGYIMTGETQSFLLGSNDIYLVKTDNTGNKLWSKVYGDTEFEKGLYVTQSGNSYYVAGYTQGFTPGNSDAKTFLMKTDLNGSVLWLKIYQEMSTPSGVCPTPEGGFLIIGSSYNLPGAGFGSTDTYVIKTDSSGNVLWSRNYGGTDSDGGSATAFTVDGYMFGGITYSFVAPQFIKAYAIKSDSVGSSGCNESSYTTTVFSANPTILTPDDSVSSGFSSNVPVVIPATLSMIRTVLCMDTLVAGTPEINLSENPMYVFPNPAIENIELLNIDFEIEKIKVFDITGRQVMLIPDNINNNSNTVIINCSELPAGIYFLTAQSKGVTKSCRFVVAEN